MIHRAIAVLFALACAIGCVRSVVLEPKPDAGSGSFNPLPDAGVGDANSDDDGGTFPDAGIVLDAPTD